MTEVGARVSVDGVDGRIVAGPVNGWWEIALDGKTVKKRTGKFVVVPPPWPPPAPAPGSPALTDGFDAALRRVRAVTRPRGAPLREHGDRRHKQYVHDQQLVAAEQVLAHWHRGERWVVLCAQMQSGKTGVMRHIGWLLNCSAASEALRSALGLGRPEGEEVVYLMQHLSDSTLLRQTVDAMSGAIGAGRIFHSPACHKFEAGLAAAGNCKVIMLDESHWGTDAGGRIAEFMAAVGAPMTADETAMRTTGGYVLSVSATPFSELGAAAARGRAVVKMLPGDAYHSLRSMIDSGLLTDNASGLFEGFPNDADDGGAPLTATAVDRWAASALEPARAAKAAADPSRETADGCFAFVRAAGSGKGAARVEHWRHQFKQLLEGAGYLVIEWDADAAHEDVLETFEEALVPRPDWSVAKRDGYLARRRQAYASAEGRNCVDQLDKLLLMPPEPTDCVIILKGARPAGKRAGKGAGPWTLMIPPARVPADSQVCSRRANSSIRVTSAPSSRSHRRRARTSRLSRRGCPGGAAATARARTEFE